MLWDPSVLDASEGIRFWGRTIPVYHLTAQDLRVFG